MKKYFVVSDVHGFYDEMKKALDEAGFDINNENHVFVSAGDLLDRGEQPLECLKFVNSLPKDRKILVRGNHEDLIEKMLCRRQAQSHDMSNGTAKTVEILSGMSLENYRFCDMCSEVLHNNEDYNMYINSLVDYAEVGDYIVVHGWIPTTDLFCSYFACDRSDYNENWRHGDWGSARWSDGGEKWHQGIIEPDKTIICGHWHVSDYHKYYHHEDIMHPWDIEENYVIGIVSEDKYNEDMYNATRPFIDKGIVALDACTVCSHRVNCFTFEVDE